MPARFVRDARPALTGRASAVPEAILEGSDVVRIHEVVRHVPVAEDVIRYAVRLAAASRPQREGAPDFVNKWVSWGAGTRAAQP